MATPAATAAPFVLRLADSRGEGTPLPLGLAGQPTVLEGKPVYYRRKEICHAVNEPHRGQIDPLTGQPVKVDIPIARLDAWTATFKRRLAKGIKPFLYPRHLDLASGEPADARHTQGYLLDVERDGEKLYGTLQLIGDEALQCAAANDVSVTVTGDALDRECIHHVAFTPNPQVTGMDGYTALVASADGSPVRVPVFVLTSGGSDAPAAKRSNPMKPETLQKLRTKFNLAADVPDEQVAEKAAELALQDPPPPVEDKTAQVTALSADNERLRADVLRLSASAPKNPDAITLAMYSDNIAAKREAAIKSGAISAAEAAHFDTLIADANGQPTPLALSASTGGRPLAFALWDAIGRLGANGVRTGNAVARTANGDGLALSAEKKADPAAIKNPTERAKAEWQQATDEDRSQFVSEKHFIAFREAVLTGAHVQA